jgi:hypothetical protein
MHGPRRGWQGAERFGHVLAAPFRASAPLLPCEYYIFFTQFCFVESLLIALGMHLLLRGAQLNLKLLDRFVERACGGRHAGSVQQNVTLFFNDQWQ